MNKRIRKKRDKAAMYRLAVLKRMHRQAVDGMLAHIAANRHLLPWLWRTR